MIQDNQFSPLGIALVAQLANTQALVTFARGCQEKDSLTTLPANLQKSSPLSSAEDLGVAIRRTSLGLFDPIDSGSTSASPLRAFPITSCSSEQDKQVELEFGCSQQRRLPAESDQSRPSEETASKLHVQPKPTRRKKPKRTNAIDDLFQVLP